MSRSQRNGALWRIQNAVLLALRKVRSRVFSEQSSCLLTDSHIKCDRPPFLRIRYACTLPIPLSIFPVESIGWGKREIDRTRLSILHLSSASAHINMSHWGINMHAPLVSLRDGVKPARVLAQAILPKFITFELQCTSLIANIKKRNNWWWLLSLHAITVNTISIAFLPFSFYVLYVVFFCLWT